MATLVALCVGLCGSWDWVTRFWCWLTKDESGSTTVRNVGLVIGAVVALGLTLRRVNVANRQAEIAAYSLLQDRYQKGAEMLGGALLPVRLGGIYALQELAAEDPERFLRPIVRQYCAFVRHPPESSDGETSGKGQAPGVGSETLREDVGAVTSAIIAFADKPKTREVLRGLSLDLRGAELGGADLSGGELCRADLSGANLSGAWLEETNLSGALLHGANLSGAKLYETDLSGAGMRGANLSGAELYRTDLSGARLYEADLSGAELTKPNLSGAWLGGVPGPSGQVGGAVAPVQGLTQDQLDKACADPLDPPRLTGAVGQDYAPLEWRGEAHGESGG